MNFQSSNVQTTQLTRPTSLPFKPTYSKKITRVNSSKNPINLLLMTVPGLAYHFLLRKDGSLDFLFLSSSVNDFFELEIVDINLEFDTETLVSLIHPDDRLHFYDSIAGAAKTLQPWRWVGRFMLASGKQKWIQWEAQPSLQANGNIFWNGLLVDVSNQQQLNAEVERLSFLLSLTERLQAFTTSQEVAEFSLIYLVQVLDCLFGDIKVMNGIPNQPEIIEFTHYFASDFVSFNTETTVSQMLAQFPNHHLEEQRLIRQISQTGQPQFLSFQQMPVLNKIGVSQLGLFPILANDGTILGILRLAFRQKTIHYSCQQELLLAVCRVLGIHLSSTSATSTTPLISDSSDSKST